MSRIKGITVTLYNKIQSGTDGFGDPIYADGGDAYSSHVDKGQADYMLVDTELAVNVDDVLVYPSTSTEILETINLYGRKAVYTMAIPKGDTNDWENKRVSFFGQEWKTFGIPTEGIDANIPLRWNKKVMVERYE